MKRKKRGTNLGSWKSNRPAPPPGKLRIIGGRWRGRCLTYSGDPRTRPMKDNIREAVFNLVGGWVTGKHVIDLFAGTGALGFEALSRGAIHATMIERHFPTARIIRENAQQLDAEHEVTLVTSDTFFWSRKWLAAPEKWPAAPWAVFCSPPYDLFLDRQGELVELIDRLLQVAPERSIFVVESDERFDADKLPQPASWRVRQYSPAQICVSREG